MKSTLNRIRTYLLATVVFAATCANAQISLPYNPSFYSMSGIAGWGVDNSNPNWYIDTASATIYITDSINNNTNIWLYSPWLNTTTVQNPVLKFDMDFTDFEFPGPELEILYHRPGINYLLWGTHSSDWNNKIVSLNAISTDSLKIVFSANFHGKGKIALKNISFRAANTVDIEEVGADNILSVSPNPSQGTFTVNWNNTNANDLEITVTDLLGSIVFKEAYTNVGEAFTKEITLNNAAKGMYVLHMQSGESVLTKRIQIQ